MYKIFPTVNSDLDIAEAIHYISQHLQAPKAAESHIKAIEDALDLLKDNPYIRPLVKVKKLADKGIRFIMVKNYMLFYRIDEDAKVVKLEAFMYSRRNWQAILENEL